MSAKHLLLAALLTISSSLAVAQNYPPSIGRVDPPNGSTYGGTPVLLTFTASDPNGGQDVAQMDVVINSWGSSTNACYFIFFPSNRSVYLFDDAASNWYPVTLGTTDQQQNSQCIVHGWGSASQTVGTELSLQLNITFKTTWVGLKYYYEHVFDSVGTPSGWWQIPEATFNVLSQPPARGLVSPMTTTVPSGTTQGFTFTASDPNGHRDIASMDVVINSVGSGTNACFWHFDRSLSRVYLFDDSVVYWTGAGLGSGDVAQNSQCVIYGSGSSLGGSDYTMNLTVNTAFKDAFAGTRYFFQQVVDATTPTPLSSGWGQLVGAYTTVIAQYALTTTVSPAGGGTIEPPGGSYSAGTVLTFTATPAPGYVFAGFSGSLSGTANPQTLTVDGPESVTAAFTQPPTLAVSCSSSPNPSYVGQTVAFSATATGGSPPYTYTWSGAASGSGATISFQPGLSQNYSETVTVRDSLGVQKGGACSATVRQLQTVSELRTCVISAPALGECALTPGAHTVDAPIVVDRSNIVVRGGSNGMNDTRLVRHSDYTGNLIQIGPNVSVSGVVLKYLTVCGGSNITPNWAPPLDSPVGCPRVQTPCGDRTRYATEHPAVDGQLPQCEDIAIVQSALPEFPPDPFKSPPASYAVEFDHVDLEDATGHALSLFAINGTKRVNDVYFHHGAINYSGVTGILMGVRGMEYTRKFCDGYTDQVLGFANDPNVFAPRNIRIEGNQFTENRTGVTGGIGRWIGYRNNTFTRNYIWPQAQGGAVHGTDPPVGDPNESWGGTLAFDACADQIHVTNDNSFIGPGSAHPNTQALEMYGRNITVDGNRFSGYELQGIVANSLNQAAIRNNTITFAAPSVPGDGGITVTTVGAGGACTDKPLNIYRESKNISISGNTIWGQHYGVNLAEHPWRSTGAIHNLTIGTNYGNWSTAQYWQNAFVWANAYNGYSGAPATLGPEEPALGITPRVLPVDVESGSTRALCALPGAARASFTFEASDDSNGSANLPGYNPRLDYGFPGYAGAAQILYLEGTFSNAGPPGGPSNTSQDCRFYYAADANVVYLDDGTGTWGAGSSPVGPGGHDLTNPNGCIIRAASSSASDTQPGQYARSVTLDVELLGPSARKHIYAYTKNKNGTTSYAPADGLSGLIWQYWGWWQKP